MKRIIALLLIVSFVFSQEAVFALEYVSDFKPVEATVDGQIQKDAFENNYQNYTNFKPNAQVLSPIEQLYNTNDSIQTGRVLKQAGYDLFTNKQSAGSGTGKFDNNYKLSIGEKVNIYLYGDSIDIMAISGSNLLSPVIKSEVDSKGNIFLQGIGVVNAENRTITEVENSLNSIAAGKYKSLKIKLNIASGQEFSVFVYGHVNNPGKVMVGNNSSLIDVLGAAGGVKKTGSLRNISYSTGGKTRTVDLYKTFYLGNDGNIIVRPNDKIFVNTIGNVVALKNGVAIPGIYETKPNENMQTIISYAGGLLAGTQKSAIVLTSLDTTTKQRKASNIPYANLKYMKIKNGDSIEFKELYNEAENIVTLQGNIKYPGTYAYKKGMHLSDILKNENELLEETFLNQAVIRRVSGKDNTVETVPIFLNEFFAGINDPLLKPKDVINIYKNTNAKFVDVYGCINTPKHITYTENMSLDSIMTDIQFVESNIDENENHSLNVSYHNDGTQAILEGGTFRNSKLVPAENVAVEITSTGGATQLYYLYDIMIASNTIKSITLHPEDKIFFRPLRANELRKTIKITGFVNNPGVYKFRTGQRLVDILEMAGGLAPNADLRGIIYTRTNVQAKELQLAQKNAERDIKLLEGRMASAFKATETDTKTTQTTLETLKETKESLKNNYNGQIVLNIKENDITKISESDNIFAQDGDAVYIPRAVMHVSVIGEVYNEQAFIYKKGCKVKDYIKEVGGYTPNANKYRIYKISMNGKAEKIKKSSSVEPGDTIVVPRRIAGNDYITPVVQVLQGIASIAIAVLAIKK